MKVLNFIANIPLFLGLGAKAVSEGLFALSFKLHMTFNTNVGKKIKEVKQYFQTLAEQQARAGLGGDNPNKLANIIKGDSENEQQPTLVKKPSDS